MAFLSEEKKLKRFVKKANEKYGNKFDYSKSEYKGVNEKLCIICPKHGEFWTSPNVHLNSKTGCPKCGLEQMAEKNILKNKKNILHVVKKFMEVDMH